MEKTSSVGEFMELNEKEVIKNEGGDVTLFLGFGGSPLIGHKVTYSDTAFKDACIWGGFGILGGALSGAPGMVLCGYAGFKASTYSSINNGSASAKVSILGF